ncbi:MAG: HAD family phosphatase [Chloroflexota bacterium]|nr:HAD family phosphatase [Chloroflexota bacterium]
MVEPTQISAVIFDMDGLMLDTERIYQVAWRSAGKTLGFHLSDAFLHTTTGRPAHDCHRLLREAHGQDFPLDQFVTVCALHWDDHVAAHGIALKPGLSELLDWLDERHIPKAVATSTAHAKALLSLRTAGLASRFEHIVGGDQIQNGKPAPDIFLAAAKRLDVNPARCLALEDSEAGVVAASTAGMMTIMVPDIKQPSAEIAARAYRVLPSLHDVRRLIEETWL